ncbi:MAG: hypothetical protein LBC61_04290 [Candidatus Peribacteria bacterium]|jgi:hypothetical protein|nr:hypothetical protein [Candidatus Peribacteria bacterium]
MISALSKTLPPFQIQIGIAPLFFGSFFSDAIVLFKLDKLSKSVSLTFWKL